MSLFKLIEETIHCGDLHEFLDEEITLDYAIDVLEEIRKKQPYIGMYTIQHDGYTTTATITDADCNVVGRSDKTDDYTIPQVCCFAALDAVGVTWDEIKKVL